MGSNIEDEEYPRLGRRNLVSMKRPLIYLGLLLVAGVLLAMLNSKDQPEYSECEEVSDIPAVNYFFGFDDTNHSIQHDTIKNGEFIADILLPYLPYPEIESLLANSKEHFDSRRIKTGRPYHIISTKDSTDKGVALVYEDDAVHYTVLHLTDSLYATKREKKITLHETTATGIIESSLYLTLTQQGLSQALAMEMADIFAWTIDFYRLQKGDSFEVLYDQRFIEDEFIGIGDIKACTFTHKDRVFEAYFFVQNDNPDYFDIEGQGMRKAFLKSPLKFGRMTSGFSGRRFHPVQKRFKSHKGTDYAAARGTPILSTGDGTVIESKYRGGNGNYVKIRHNSTYTTQYLHMSKRGAKVGDVVKQGDVIGYVGSTGLATGPHVCYRFWKNGSQVNHRQEEFPSTDPILPENMERFLKEVHELRARLQSKAELVVR